MARTSRLVNGASGDAPPSPRAPKKGNGAAKPFNDTDRLNEPDAVARRAFEIYQGRGGNHGADLDDWLEAERQLRPGPSDVTGPAPTKPRKRKASGETGL